MEYLVEFASTSMALSLVAIGLLLLQRCHGVAFLEMVPLASGLALFPLSLGAPFSASTVRPSGLVIPILFCASLLIILQPYYRRWRLRVAGESTTLLLSFASMNCCLLLFSITTKGRAVSVDLADASFIGGKTHLELLVIGLSGVFLTVLPLYLRKTRLIAAMQLAKDDHRLLTTFGRNPITVRAHILLIAMISSAFGVGLYISLQESFSIVNSYSIIVPAFAISISLSRIRVPYVVISMFVLVASRQLLTQFTSESLRDCHEGMLFSLFVLAAIGSRRATIAGIDWLVFRTFLKARPVEAIR
jgi:hypothetical protein